MSEALARQPRGKPRAPWEKRADETDAAFAAFVVYRDQAPPRSVRKLAAALERGKTILEGWSRKHNWVERAAAYTDHLDRLMVKAHEEDLVARRKAVNDQIFGAAQEVHVVAMSRLMGVDTEDAHQKVLALDPNELDPDDIIRWLEFSAKWSRLAIGLPSDMTGATVITLQDLAAILKGFFAEAENRMERDEFEAFVRACYAFIQERLGA